MKPENINPELMEKLKKAKSIKEIREISKEAGYVLSDEELDGVAGGTPRCHTHCETHGLCLPLIEQ